jgi:hypothetical protein
MDTLERPVDVAFLADVLSAAVAIVIGTHRLMAMKTGSGLGLIQISLRHKSLLMGRGSGSSLTLHQEIPMSRKKIV